MKELVELKEAFHDFKRENDAALEQMKARGEADSLKLACVDELSEKMSALQDTITELEKKASRPQIITGDKVKSECTIAHEKAFDQWVRNPRDHDAVIELKAAEKALAEEKKLQGKAVNITTTTDGGFAVPEVIDGQIDSKLLDISPMMKLCRVVQVGTSDWKQLVNVRGQLYAWVGDGDTRSDQDTSKLQEVAPTFGTIYAYPKATEESLQDLFFDVAGWIVEESEEALMQGIGIAATTGNGTKKPTGIIAGSTAATDDEASPARAFGTIEHIATGVAAAFPNDRLGSPAGNPGDILVDVVYALKAGYRANAAWQMNKATLKTVRKWKDNDGNYLWAPSLAAGQPSTLVGYSLYENEAMADIGANALPMMFGDYRKAYTLAVIAGTRVTVDEITTPGYTKYYVRKRLGGKLVNDDAVKVVKVATS